MSSTAWRSDVPIAESYRGVLPFLASDLVRLLLLLFFPVALAVARSVRGLGKTMTARSARHR